MKLQTLMAFGFLILASCTSSPTSNQAKNSLNRTSSRRPSADESQSIRAAINPATDCSSDVLCQSIRTGLKKDGSLNAGLDNCKFHSANPEWCYTIKRAVYDSNCSTRYGDQWTVPEMCMTLRHVLDGGNCDDPSLTPECSDFAQAGYSRQAVQNFNQ